MQVNIYRFVVTLFMAVLSLGVMAGGGSKRFTLVIDAGHGGKDAGACGVKSKEKTLTLRYALAFGEMVERNCPDVKVVYTRKTDRFLELWQRAEVANKNKADLFISVHINAVKKGSPRGFQTYTLGRGRTTGSTKGFIENLEVAKRENAVIYLEKDYKQTYHGYDPNSPESDIMFEFVQDDNMVSSAELAKLMQRYVCAATGRQDQGAHQDNLAVLRLTSMPGCLLELGFISTRDEEQFMNADSSTEKYARGMFNAFQAYRKLKGKGGAVVAPEVKADKTEAEAPAVKTVKSEEPAVKTAKAEKAEPEVKADKDETADAKVAKADSSAAPVFKVQFLTSGTRLKKGTAQFKGLNGVDSYKEGALWKYTVGASPDYDSINRLRREVSSKFPQAFIVAFKDGKRMDLNQARLAAKKQKK